MHAAAFPLALVQEAVPIGRHEPAVPVFLVALPLAFVEHAVVVEADAAAVALGMQQFAFVDDEFGTGRGSSTARGGGGSWD